MPSPLVCLGLGYTTSILAKHAPHSPVIATNRQAPDHPRDQIQHHSLDIETCSLNDLTSLIPKSSHVIYSIPTLAKTIDPNAPTRHIDPVLKAYKAALSSQAKSFLYLSSSSVYGDHHGAWVHEDTPCSPSSPMGVMRLEIEEALKQAATKPTLVRVARIVGIYGPERTMVNMIQQGRYKLWKQAAQKVTNRVHVDDLVHALLAILKHTETPQQASFRRYNISDGHPITALALVQMLHDQFDIPLPQTEMLPPLEANDASANLRARRINHYRVDTSRLSQETGWTPNVKDALQGYRQILEQP